MNWEASATATTWAAAVWLLGCSIEPIDLSSFVTGETGGTGDMPPAERPDVPLGPIERPVVLDLPECPGCDQMDLLFVVDNSGSMEDEQEALALADPGFVEHLQDLGYGWDLHVGVVTTDEPQSNPPNCRRIGALIRGQNACDDPTFGRGYLTDAELDRFDCLFFVGTDGDAMERQAEAAVAAIKPSVTEAGAEAWPGSYRDDWCNVGFLRPDAALVIVMLTDEEDYKSQGDPEQWATEIAWLNPGPTILVALIPTECGTPQGRLHRLTTKIPSHTAPICSTNYPAELEAALATIGQECGPHTPEG